MTCYASLWHLKSYSLNSSVGKRPMDLNPNLSKLQLAKTTIKFQGLSGTVISEKTWSETRVSSTGGGGYMGPYGGQISAPNVRTQVTAKRELWLKGDDEKEHSIRLTGSLLPVREGHRVSVLWGIKDGQSSGPYVLLTNNTIGSSEVQTSGCVALIQGGIMGTIVNSCAFLLLLIFGAIAISTGSGMAWIGTLLLGAFLCWKYNNAQVRFGILQSRLQEIATNYQKQA